MGLDQFIEKIDSPSPNRAGFGIEGGRAEMTYISTEMLTAEDEKDTLLELLGDVEVGDDGKLHRTLPRAHPRYPWLFASAVDIQGFGTQDEWGDTSGPENTEAVLEADAMMVEHYAYVKTLLRVTFTPRPYALLADSSIEPADLVWNSEVGGTEPSVDSGEYKRFVDVEIDPAPTIATAQHGMASFKTFSGAPNNNTFSGHPYIIVPDGQVRIIWYQVPYRLMLDFDHAMWTSIGRVNQLEFLGFAPGRLVYLGPKARRYTPCVPAYSDDVYGAFSAEKLCDLSFQCNFTMRNATEPPNVSNDNYIADGWNIQPWLANRKYYYVGESQTNDKPFFLSIPFQNLFEIFPE